VGVLRLSRLQNARFHGGGSDGRTWREGVLSLKHRRCNETNQYHPTQQSPHENDRLPGNENVHGRTSGTKSDSQLPLLYCEKLQTFRGHPCQSSSLRSCKREELQRPEPGSFERVETSPRLKRLLRKKVGTETTRRRITAAAMPPHSMRAQLFYCPHFLPAVAVSTTHYQQLLAPPVPRSRCND
jgi:hypothetical protein